MLSKIEVGKLWSYKWHKINTQDFVDIVVIVTWIPSKYFFLDISLSKVNENVEDSVWPQKDARI